MTRRRNFLSYRSSGSYAVAGVVLVAVLVGVVLLGLAGRALMKAGS